MLTTLLGVVTLSLGWGEAPAVWHDDYARAVTQATSGDKPLFIVICSKSSPYGQMASLGTFLSDRIERTLQTDYVRFVIDTETVSGRNLADQFEASDGPHFVILDRSGKWQVYYHSGTLLEADLAPVLARFRRTKLSANGRRIQEVSRRQFVQVCST